MIDTPNAIGIISNFTIIAFSFLTGVLLNVVLFIERKGRERYTVAEVAERSNSNPIAHHSLNSLTEH